MIKTTTADVTEAARHESRVIGTVRVRDYYETLRWGKVVHVRGWNLKPKFHSDGRVTCKWRGKDRAIKAERNEVTGSDGVVRGWFSFDWAE